MTGCNRASDAEPAGPLTVTVAELPLNRRVRLEHEGRAVEVLRTETGVTARSLLCTHQGCNVRWVEKDQIYLCPCHEGKFDSAGIPFYGPPREPLRTLPVTLTATEAVIGAVYLDGGYDVAYDFIAQHFRSPLNVKAVSDVQGDYKSRLQELVQVRSEHIPQYQIIEESGPDHDKTFRVQLTVGEIQTEGIGKSKKAAEQAAALPKYAGPPR